ncbi:MAG TPA: hypothetical protein VKU60_00165 [Chloroflexota bacterium]|nr:hypothetical protein [Chloroflexota bacterium]
MDIGVELSLYPLNQQYIPPIQDFIDRLNLERGLRVETNSMSTQVFGDYELVMRTLTRELRKTFESNDKAVFAMKVLGPLGTP